MESTRPTWRPGPGFDAGYVQLWCRSAYAFELLDWDQTTGYGLAPGMGSLLLDSTDPLFIGGRIQFFAGLYEASAPNCRTGSARP